MELESEKSHFWSCICEILQEVGGGENQHNRASACSKVKYLIHIASVKASHHKVRMIVPTLCLNKEKPSPVLSKGQSQHLNPDLSDPKAQTLSPLCDHEQPLRKPPFP